MLSDVQLIEVFKALADPHRMNLFKLLLVSDQSNSELISATGLSQNLLSHHLNVLCNAGLIYWQQSIGDARRRYFSPNLALIMDVGHWWRVQIPVSRHPLPALKKTRRVLFLCYHNASRSLMAEVIARHLVPGDTLEVISAGLRSAEEPISPHLYTVLAENGIQVANLPQQTYHSFASQHFDYVITVCDWAHEHLTLGTFAGATFLHWSLHEPTTLPPERVLPAMRQLYQDLSLRIQVLVRRLAAEEA